MKARIFLSYSQHDGDEACTFFERALRNLGHLVYRDRTNNYPGDYWEQKIKGEIRNADAVALIVTPQAMRSDYVTKEWKEALALHKRILPLVVPPSPDPASIVPSEIAALHHYRDLREPAIRELEPTVIDQGLEALQRELVISLDGVEEQLRNDVPDLARQTYLRPLLDDLRLFIGAEPRARPPEVLQLLLDLARQLIRTLAADGDIAPLLDAMIVGTYQRGGWDDAPVYAQWLDTIAQALTKVRRGLPEVRVPVVVVAMTAAEAAELASGAAFAGWPRALREEFTAIQAELPDGWHGRYGAAREDWRPFGTGTVRDIVQQAFQLIECRDPLRPKFLDVRSLREPTRRRLLLALRATNCLVVIDSISSRHPALLAAFRAAHLDVSLQSVIVRAVANQSLASLAAELSDGVREWLECEFFRRSQLDDDSHCEDVTQADGLQRAIRRELSRLVPECSGRGEPRSDLWSHINKLGVAR